MESSEAIGYLASQQQASRWSVCEHGSSREVRCAIEISGPLAADRLMAALQAVVSRHEILRTVFLRQAGLRTPLQRILPEALMSWDDSPLDLELGPVIQARLSSERPDRHHLTITVSGMCADAMSLKLMVMEAARNYCGSTAAGQSDVPQHADYAEWQRQFLADDPDGLRAADYWRQQLPALSPRARFQLEPLATDERSPTLFLNEDITAQLNIAAAQMTASVETVLLAAWVALLSRLSGTEHIVIGVQHQGRTLEELREAIGPYDKLLPVAVDCPETLRFSELVQHIAAKKEELDRHHEGWAALDLHAQPDIELAFEHVDLSEPIAAGAMHWEITDVTSSECDCPGLQLATTQFSHGIRLSVKADESKYGSGSAGRVADYFQRLLTEFLTAPEQLTGDPVLIGDDEVAQLQAETERTSCELPSTSVPELFEAAAKAHPEAPAVRCGSEMMSYGELLTSSGRIARHLQDQGIGAGAIVGLFLDRSVELVAAILGVLRSGAAYLPLHEDAPAERLAVQLADAQAAAVISRKSQAAKLPSTAATIIWLDDLTQASAEVLPRKIDPDSTAYVLFTSGSTGTPKGVAVGHRSLVNYSLAVGRRLGAFDETHPTRSFASVTTVASDLGNTAIFPALITGSCLHLIPFEVTTDAEALAEWSRKHPYDVLKITPSHLAALLAHRDAADILPRRCLVTGGEALTWDLVARVKSLGSCRLLNHYGPTETTVGATVCPVDEIRSLETSTRSVPIGRPIDNTRCYIVDKRLRLVPHGVAGELLIGGAGVAQGYLQRADETAKRFVEDPLLQNGSLVYRTGDLVRRVTGGWIEFLGRNDDQVKIRGYRVECSEVSRNLERHPAVQAAVVLGLPDPVGQPRLTAFVQVANAARLAEQELVSHLKQFLPEYMVPQQITALDAFPLDRNGKVDRQALSRYADTSTAHATRSVELCTETERKLAAIWSAILGVPQIDRQDDFLAIGGHSLSAMQVIAKIHDTFQVKLPLPVMFDALTLSALAAEIDRRRPSGDDDVSDEELLAQLQNLSPEMVEALLGQVPETDAG